MLEFKDKEFPSGLEEEEENFPKIKHSENIFFTNEEKAQLKKAVQITLSSFDDPDDIEDEGLNVQILKGLLKKIDKIK